MFVRNAIAIQYVSMGMRVLLIILSRHVDCELIGLWADVAMDQRFHKSFPQAKGARFRPSTVLPRPR